MSNKCDFIFVTFTSTFKRVVKVNHHAASLFAMGLFKEHFSSGFSIHVEYKIESLKR